jgi:hypothetical protein
MHNQHPNDNEFSLLIKSLVENLTLTHQKILRLSLHEISPSVYAGVLSPC